MHHTPGWRVFRMRTSANLRWRASPGFLEFQVLRAVLPAARALPGDPRAASFLTWLRLLGRCPATRISVSAFLTPVFALLLGALRRGKVLGGQLLVGVALPTVGVVLVNRRPAAE